MIPPSPRTSLENDIDDSELQQFLNDLHEEKMDISFEDRLQW